MTTDEVVVFDVIGIDADYNVIPIDDYEIELSITGGGILHEDGTFEPRTKGHYSVYANTTVDSLEISDQYDFQIIQGSGIKLEIFPPPAPIHAGSDALFTVKIFDSKSNSFTPSVIEWSVSGGGTISELGILEARTKGEFTVNAVYINNKNESINGSLKFTVNIGKLQGINIMTQATVLFVNGTVEIYAQGYDGFGNKEIIEPEWNIVGGDYDNYSNTYHAQSAGTWTIYANSSGVSGKVTLYINDKPLSSIVIESDNPIMMIDDEIQLTARGYDADGNELFIDPQWVPTGGGYIDSSGKFKAQEQGIWLLYANFSGISASIEIIINLYDLSRIEVYPAVITLKINEVKKFNATGFASNGVDISIKPIWSITGTRTFGASIDEEGYFVANETGTWRIYASQGGYVGNAEAIVVVDDDKTTPEEDDKEKAFIDEAYLIPLTIIIAAVVVVIILFLIIIRTKNKLEQDKEYVEAEQVAIEEEYSRIYGDSPSGAGGAPVGDSWGERMYPEESGLKTPPPPPPPPGRKPGHRVKEVRVTRRKMRRKSDAVTQPPPGETPSVPAGPMRYGYKAKKVDSGVPVKAPPNVKGSRKLRDKDKKKDQKDDQQIEWD